MITSLPIIISVWYMTVTLIITSGIENYDNAISLDSRYAKAYNNREVVYKTLKDYSKAIAHFNMTITYVIKVFILLSLSFIISIPAFSQENGRVQKVYDGDTVLLSDGRKVRYLGINTPEWGEPFYLKAKRLNESLVLGKDIRLEFDKERADKYGRLLAYVYVGDQMVNARLIEEGLAHAFFIPPNQKHNALLLRLQSGARERKAGMWSTRGKMSVLKVTSVRSSNYDEEELIQPYVRITNISNSKINLAGYKLSSEARISYTFPDIELTPGYTILVISGKGNNRIDSKGQLIVYWDNRPAIWDKEEDTAYLTSPDGTLIDFYHYKGRRVSRKSKPKAP